MSFTRLERLANNEDEERLPEEIEDDDDDPEPETLKYANRSGSYLLCVKSGIGKFLEIVRLAKRDDWVI